VASVLPAQQRLIVADRVPQLHLQERDALVFLPFFRQFRDEHALYATADGPSGRGSSDGEADDRARGVADIAWYHTIELPGGITTPGMYDHRPLVPYYGLPADLEGQRALDVATFDGFWAFELERRGAQVVATDVDRFSECDYPPPVKTLLLEEDLDRKTSLGFEIAHHALSSKVERRVRDVYDLNVADDGTFDLVHVADLLLHLQDPLAALQAIRSVTTGRAFIADCFDPDLESGTSRYFGGWCSVPFWLPSLETLAQMVIDAGFSDVSVKAVYTLAPKHERGRGYRRALLLATP
jgi:tRNA (mo5U34)-methyltransferase